MGEFEKGFNADWDVKKAFVAEVGKEVVSELVGRGDIDWANVQPDRVNGDALIAAANMDMPHATFLLGVVARAEVREGFFVNKHAVPGYHEPVVIPPVRRRAAMTVMQFEIDSQRVEEKLYRMRIADVATAKARADKRLERTKWDDAKNV